MSYSEIPKTTSDRRSFLFLVPTGVIGSIFAAIVSRGFGFLRPVESVSGAQWLDLMNVSQINGAEPIRCSITSQETAGWASTRVEHHVYLLPGQNNQVISAVCPHEGCEVSWQKERRVFACPCHDSSFASDGSQINGPARRSLDPLPTRMKEGTLQVQYQSFVNNTQERTVRG